MTAAPEAPGSKAAVLGRISRERDKLEAAIACPPEARRAAPLLDDGWSVKDIMACVALLDLDDWPRGRVLGAWPSPVWPPVADDTWLHYAEHTEAQERAAAQS